MTRKDYNALAKAYRNALDDTKTQEQVFTWLAMVKATARVLADDNLRFNHELFLRACGVDVAIGESALAELL